MMSIRRQLLSRLLPPLLILSIISVAGLYLYVRHVLSRDFDRSLEARADAIAAGIRWNDRRAWQITSPDAELAEFSNARHVAYFQVWSFDGQSALRSESLGGRDLRPKKAAGLEHLFSNLTLPDGRSGRAVTIQFVPHPDADDAEILREGDSPKTHLTLVLAQGRYPLDNPLAVLLTSLSLVSSVFIIGVVAIVALAVRRSLQPLIQVAKNASENASISAAHVFPQTNIPVELAPICQYLNQLLERLQSAYQRERRFSSDVAHELRTPIAELRAVSEVALKYPGEGLTASEALSDARAIARHMEALVGTLLALARCEADLQPISVHSIDLVGLVERLWQPLADKAARRLLIIARDSSANVKIHSDPTLVESIVANLLSNAVEYTPVGGRISCDICSLHPAGAVLEISNTVDILTSTDLAHLTDPFWRKDPARSGGDHCGLGLSLAAAYAKKLGADLRFDLPKDRWFRAALSVPSSNPSSPPNDKD